jgi:hypothetical protein
MDPPKRIRNSLSRAREYLTPTEIDKLIAAARHTGRHGQRDADTARLSTWIANFRADFALLGTN